MLRLPHAYANPSRMVARARTPEAEAVTVAVVPPCMSARLTSTATYESAFSQKHPASPTAASITPATAGPAIRAMLNAAELSAMPFGRSSRPVISTMIDWRAGRSNVLARPYTTASTITIHGRTTPALTTHASATAWSSIVACVTSSSERLGV
jgi:hypothetical protein